MKTESKNQPAERTLSLPDTILGVTLGTENKNLLLQGHETQLIKGFVDKEGRKFDAYLSLNEQNKFVFRSAAESGVRSEVQPGVHSGDFSDAVPNVQAVEKDIQQLLPATDFMTVARLCGFSEVSQSFTSGLPTSQSSEGWLRSNPHFLVLSSGTGVQIAIYNLPGGETEFSELGRPAVSGDIRDFYAHYISPFPLDFLATLKRASLEIRSERKASKKDADDASRKFPESLEKAVSAQEILSSVSGLESLLSKTWFEKYQIKETSLDHTFFRNRVLSLQTPGKNSNVPVFPLFTESGLSGFANPDDEQLEDGRPALQCFGKGVWMSNVINEEKIRRLVIVSHPLEALAYHQMNARPSDLMSLYLACCSGDSKQDAYWTQKIIDRYKPEQVIIGTARNAEGMMLSTYLFGQLSEPHTALREKDSFKVENTEIKFTVEPQSERNNAYACLTVSLTYPDFEKGVFMNENLARYFEQINKREIADHAEYNGIAPFSLISKEISKHSSRAGITFPNRKAFLEITEKVVQHLRPLLFLKSEIPEASGFLEDMQIAAEQKNSLKEQKTRRAG